MNDKQKSQIRKLREENKSYAEIGRLLGIKDSTVKTYCRRNGLNGVRGNIPDKNDHLCKNCGVPVAQKPGRKEKIFCCSFCRNSWWNSHLELVNRKANYEIVCPGCGKTFISYGNRNRKYCSHSCYIADRFGGDRDERYAV